MKKVLAALMVACAVQVANASPTVFNDATGDTFPTNAIMDIVSLEADNDASTLTLKLTLAGDVVATDWGKYMVIMDTVPGGDTTGNGWARPISMTSGADYWIGSWVDGGNGIQKYNWAGGWNLTNANGPFAGPGGTPAADPNVGISKVGNTVTLSVSLSSLGLSVGNVVLFDAFSSGGGGGDGAVDSLGNPNQQIADWGNASEAHPVAYTIQPIPEPASLVLLGVGALALIRRKR